MTVTFQPRQHSGSSGEPVATWQPADGEQGRNGCHAQPADGERGGERRRRDGPLAPPVEEILGSWTSIGALECERFFTCTESAPVMGSGVILACRSVVTSLLWTAPGISNSMSAFRAMLSGTRTLSLSVEYKTQHGQRDAHASRQHRAHSTKNRLELTPARVRRVRIR